MAASENGKGSGVLADCQPHVTRYSIEPGRLGGEQYNPANRTRFVLMAGYPIGGRSPAELRAQLLQLLTEAGFSGAGVVDVDGLYKGQSDPGCRAEVIVSLASDPDAGNRMIELAETLAIEWDQEEIWLTTEPVSLMRIGR